MVLLTEVKWVGRKNPTTIADAENFKNDKAEIHGQSSRSLLEWQAKTVEEVNKNTGVSFLERKGEKKRGLKEARMKKGTRKKKNSGNTEWTTDRKGETPALSRTGTKNNQRTRRVGGPQFSLKDPEYTSLLKKTVLILNGNSRKAGQGTLQEDTVWRVPFHRRGPV